MKRAFYIFLFLFMIIVISTNYTTVSAKSWVPSDSSIYKGQGTTVDTVVVEEPPGFAEKTFSSLLRTVANALSILLGEAKISLDAIIYGRVMGFSKVNFFSFELANNNPYGIAGAFTYTILRSVILVTMTYYALFVYVKAAWSSGIGQAREKIKTDLGGFLISFLLLFLMPRFIEILLYLRDVLLYVVGKEIAVNSLIGSTTIGVVEQYRKLANETKGLVPGAMYLSSVILSVYFAFLYVFSACIMMISFIFFPMVSQLSLMDNKLIGNWVKLMVSTALTPLIDAVLLVIPLFGEVLGAPSIVVFIMCMAIIPARGTVRMILRIGGSAGSELLGFGAMMMAGNLLKGGISAAKNMKNSYSDSKSDNQKADMYEELASNESAADIPELRSTRYNEMTQQHNYGNYGTMAGNDLVNTSTDFSYSSTGKRNSSYQNPIMTSERREILSNYATMDNFENPEFREVLGDSEKASFYRQRAHRATVKQIGAVVGGLGGAGLALSGSMFNSPSSRLALAGIGGTVGATIGSYSYEAAQALGMNDDNNSSKNPINNKVTQVPQTSVNVDASGTIDINNGVQSNENINIPNEQSETSSYDNYVVDMSGIDFNTLNAIPEPQTQEFTNDQYQQAISRMHETNGELVSKVQSLMNEYVSNTGNVPHTKAYDLELLRVNANERSNILGNELGNLNVEADILKEVEMSFNVLQSRTNVGHLYEQYKLERINE